MTSFIRDYYGIVLSLELGAMAYFAFALFTSFVKKTAKKTGDEVVASVTAAMAAVPAASPGAPRVETVLEQEIRLATIRKSDARSASAPETRPEPQIKPPSDTDAKWREMAQALRGSESASAPNAPAEPPPPPVAKPAPMAPPTSIHSMVKPAKDSDTDLDNLLGEYDRTSQRSR
jgi:hypothetical protein